MGVHGLWRLIEPSGKPVPLETLENKILAVDVSIWLHQAVKGFQDARGQPLPNAHLLGIYHRVCKLLYFRIRPIFVFDGGVPTLKKQTIAKRNQQKAKNFSESGKVQKQLLNTLLKHYAVSKVLSEKTKANIEASVSSSSSSVSTKDDLYALPPNQLESSISSSGEESDITETETTSDSSPTKHWDIHSIDMDSSYFKSLPADVRHEILTEMKETRKQSSWGRLHELPAQSDDFAVFQMKRLRKRHLVQVSLEQAEQEMGGHSLSLGELESLLNDQGVVTDNKPVGNRIASDENTRYLLVKDIKKAMDKAKQDQLAMETIKEVEEDETTDGEAEQTNACVEDMEKHKKSKADLEYENDLQRAIQLSLEAESEIPKVENLAKFESLNEVTLHENFKDADFESDSSVSDQPDDNPKVLLSAKNYMMEYSGLTPSEIAKIIGENSHKRKGIDKNLPASSNAKIKLNKNSDTDKLKKNIDDFSSVRETNEMLKIPTSDYEKKSNPDSAEATLNIESDSSEDFIEVSDTNNEESTSVKIDKNLEILVKPMENLEDDIFSDIFTHSSNKENVTETNSQSNASTPEINKSPSLVEESVQLQKSGTDLNYTNKESTNEEPQKVTNTDIPHSLSCEQLENLRDDLVREKTELISEHATKDRLASNITDQMYQEAQELLELFGVPYIIAPMEAEAQCAFLNEVNLTDGTITDDSDIWLFGGKTVYKNFFNQSKHVMEFRAENIQHCFNLTREQMILLALLVGSDYTTGIQGIGPVTALEVLAAFPYSKTTEIQLSHHQLLSGLAEFRKWLTGEKVPGRGRTSLKNKLKNVVLSDSFPSLQVVQAYLEPTIESSREAFSWAKPDLVGLIDFAREKFGWSKTKSEEILKPVLKRLLEKHTQTSIRNYFQTTFKRPTEVPKHTSKRIRQALDKIGNPNSLDEEKTVTEAKVKGKRKYERKEQDDTSSNEKESTKSMRNLPKEQEKCDDFLDEKIKVLKQKKQDDTSSKEKETAKPKRKIQKNQEKRDHSSDEDIRVLKQTKVRSKKKLLDIKTEIKNLTEEKARKERIAPNPHKPDVIIQKEKEKAQALRTKLKAIEVFRKSKQGPGFVKKRAKIVRKTKEDAELSESSSD